MARQFETIHNPPTQPAPNRHEVDGGVISQTEGSLGGNPVDYGVSAKRLLVRGSGELISKGSPDLSILRQEKLRPESLIGHDDRSLVVDSETLPWRMICCLKINGSQGSGIGTGWFAGPKTIITAGHCVFHPSIGGWADEIVVFPGRFGAETPYPKDAAFKNPIVSTRFSALKGWTDDQNTNFDYAAIHIDDPVGNETGWFSLAALDNETLKGLLVNIAGYPADRDFGRNQYVSSDKIEKVESDRFYYAADTYGGQSGGPAWIQDVSNQPMCIGIHSYGVGGSFTLNSATRITDATIGILKSWIDADS